MFTENSVVLPPGPHHARPVRGLQVDHGMITRHHRPSARLLVTGFAAALSGILLALPVSAADQECTDEWRDPVVCAVELSIVGEGERRERVIERDTLELPTRTAFDLYADPYDQWGERFPLRRFDLRIEPGDRRRGCDDLLTIERTEEEEGRMRLETGDRTGTCELLLWVPGNLNLDRELRIEVSRERATGRAHSKLELLARWLFQGILGREGDDAGLRAAANEIQKGQLRAQVEAMVGSPEFRKRRAGLPARELLEDLYQGLLGRRPDSSGVRRYLDDVERGNLTGVVLELLQSDELDKRLNEAMRQRIDF